MKVPDLANDHALGVHGDRPLPKDGIDYLGFTELAQQLATALVDRASSDGIVVGLEGEWGSGKTSLLERITGALASLPEARRPTVLSFQPWLIGNREALLASLFDELARAVDELQEAEGDATGSTRTKIKDLTAHLRKYGRRLGSLAPIASLASLASIPGAAVAEQGFKALKELAKEDEKQEPLANLKKRISAELSDLTRRIVVTIDDVDRLEPKEIAEILRLVRSVADFKNVVYVLCYDSTIVAEAIRTAMHVGDGRKYLEKIVQVVVRIPAPEPFALRRMFERGLREFAEPLNEEAARRLADVIDEHGGPRLKTPRAVNRTLDALRLMWPALRQQVDLSDLVWLQLVRMTNPSLYEWIESYSASMAALSSGRVMVRDQERMKSFEQLNSALQQDGVSFEEIRWRLQELLPGISAAPFKDASSVPLFASVPDRQRLKASNEKRLSSPDHHRLYFALAISPGAVIDTDYIALWQAADDGVDHLEELLRKWLSDRSSTIASKAEIMLDRLQGVPEEALAAKRSTNLFLALANVLDDLAATKHVVWSRPSVWHEAERLLPTLRARMGAEAKCVMTQGFREGRAIGWLVEVFRSETFDHGRYGDRRRPDTEWIMPDEEFDEIIGVMHTRFAKMEMVEIMATPEPISLLFAWSQTGGADSVREKVANFVSSDDGLLNLLEHAAGKVISSSEGRYSVISRSSLEAFTDPDQAYARVVSIAKGSGPLAPRAESVRKQLNRARDA